MQILVHQISFISNFMIIFYSRYLTEPGFELVSDYGNITDVQKIIKLATEVFT